jgi:tRNA modification GTPase
MKWTRLAAQSLALARTERVAAILLDQYNGAFSGALDRIRHSLQSGQTDDARRVLNDLQSNTLLGQRLLEPWKVVLAGPPNVGKSSLLNALAGYQRSIVTPQPGTTRDCVSVVTAFEGWPVELIDTAGLHSADDELEQEGIARSREMAQQADLALWIYDATSFEPIGPSQEITSRKCLHVINKCDLEPQRRLDDVMDAFRVSARTGAGIDALGSRIARELAPVAPPAGSAVPFHSECSDLLTRLAALVDSGLLAEAGQMLASAGA